MKKLHCVLLAVACAVTSACADVELVPGKLAADITAWANCRWQQAERAGFGETSFDMYRRAALVGLTGYLGTVASVRTCFDAGSASPYDVYMNFRWPSGVELRAGQFVPPLGFEACTEPQEAKLIDYSIVERHWKPWGVRDIGLMVSYDRGHFAFASAVVNGNGRNVFADENVWKDVCGRLVLRPWSDSGPELACRAYYGRFYREGIQFWNIAGEVLLDRHPFQVLAEVQHTSWGGVIRNSIHTQAAWKLLDLLEPVARLEVEFLSEDKYVMGVTGGTNISVLKDHLRVMLNYNYARRRSFWAEHIFSQQTVALQLQATI